MDTRNNFEAYFSELANSLGTPTRPAAFLVGMSGVNFVLWQLTKDPELLDELEILIRDNINNPMRELMWAAPGTMLAAYFLYHETNQARWHEFYQLSANYLLQTWDYHPEFNCHIWTQDLYGVSACHLGLLHGAAGNIHALSLGIDWLTEEQRKTLANCSLRLGITINNIQIGCLCRKNIRLSYSHLLTIIAV